MPSIYEIDCDGYTTGESRQIGDSDPCPLGWAREEPPSAPADVTQARLRDQLAAYVMQRRDDLIDSGITFGGAEFQTRAADRENLIGAYALATFAVSLGAQPGNLRWHGGVQDFGWIPTDNTLVPMDAQTVIAFGSAVAVRKSLLIFLARGLKDQIAAGTVTTEEEIDSAIAAALAE